MIIYTVLDPDDGSGLTYWWYGDTMVYVHQDGVEIDAYHLDSASSGGSTPTLDEVTAEIERHHRER